MKRPLPTDRSAVYRTFFEGLSAGKIVVQQCSVCGTTHWPPREMCQKCYSTDIGGVEVSNQGTVYTFTVNYRAFHPAFIEKTPYAVVTVDVGGGVKIFGEYGGDPEALRIGDEVRATFFEETPDVSLIRWVPVLKEGANK